MEEPEKIVSQTELDDRAQKLVEDKDADSRLRVYIGPMEKALTAVLLQTLATQTPLVVLYREGEHTMYEVNLERLAEIP